MVVVKTLLPIDTRYAGITTFRLVIGLFYLINTLRVFRFSNRIVLLT
jgi:hypothetical protein